MYVKVYGYDGTFVKGDPKILALCFWSAFQGIMEELTISKKLDTPDPEWLMAILRK